MSKVLDDTIVVFLLIILCITIFSFFLYSNLSASEQALLNAKKECPTISQYLDINADITYSGLSDAKSKCEDDHKVNHQVIMQKRVLGN